MDGGDRESLAVQELVQLIGALLGLDEDQSQARVLVGVVIWKWTAGNEVKSLPANTGR